MASDEFSHNQQHKQGERQSSGSTHPAPPSGSHDIYPGAGRSPAMGYPPSMGYPPTAPGQYSGYPPPGYYPYAQAPPPPAYYNATVHQQQGYQRPSSFSRCFLTTIIFLVMLIFTSSIITWLLLRPQLPVFHVDNFSVSNFSANWPTFTSNWEANLTVRNPNTKLKIEFGQLQNFVFYDKDYLLASAISQPFSLETKTSNVIQARLSANNKENWVENWVVDKLAKERNNGAVSFKFRMAFWTTLRSSFWWKRHLSMKVLCEDIQVTFVGASGFGNIAANGHRDCLVFA